MQPMIPKPDADNERLWEERKFDESWESPDRGMWGFVLFVVVLAVALVLVIVLTSSDPIADPHVTSTLDTTIPGVTEQP